MLCILSASASCNNEIATPVDAAAMTPVTYPPTASGIPERAEVGPRTLDLSPYDGVLRVTSDGAIVEKRHITGRLLIEANHVTVRDCIIDGNKATGAALSITTNSPITGLTIEHSEVRNAQIGIALGANAGSRLRGGTTANQLRHLYIHHVGDGVQLGSDFTLFKSIIQTQYWNNNHSDGVQISNRGHVDIIASAIEVGRLGPTLPQTTKTNLNAAVFLAQDFAGPITNVHVIDSYLDGGAYAYRHWEPGKSTSGFTNPTASSVRNSWFGPSAKFGPAFVHRGPDNSPTWVNNQTWPARKPIVAPEEAR